MDWTKVVKAFDDEWDRRRQLADRASGPAEYERQLILAGVASMLRDSLVVGLSEKDRKRAKL